jgi:hypothetical protein
MAEIVRCAGQSFIERSRYWITCQHQKVLRAITRFRIARRPSRSQFRLRTYDGHLL